MFWLTWSLGDMRNTNKVYVVHQAEAFVRSQELCASLSGRPDWAVGAALQAKAALEAGNWLSPHACNTLNDHVLFAYSTGRLLNCEVGHHCSNEHLQP